MCLDSEHCLGFVAVIVIFLRRTILDCMFVNSVMLIFLEVVLPAGHEVDLFTGHMASTALYTHCYFVVTIISCCCPQMILAF